MMRTIFTSCTLAAALVVGHAAEAAPQRTQTSSLRVTVKDPSGAVVPGALVQVKGAEDRTAAITRTDIPSDGQGVAVADGLTPGRYAIASASRDSRH